MAEHNQSNSVIAPDNAAQIVRRVIDPGDGAGKEIFEASGLTREEALEALADKLADGKLHATKKIRQQEAELRRGRVTNEAVNTFVAAHDDYVNDGQAGDKNGELMRMKLVELGLPLTAENLSTAYSQLKEKGLLHLKGEEIEATNSGADWRTESVERIVQPKVESAPQRMKRTSSIGTHNRAIVAPTHTQLSEDDLYKLPLEDLRKLANKQLGARGY